MSKIESKGSLDLSAKWLGLESDEKITIHCYLSPAICDSSNEDLVPARWFSLDNDACAEDEKVRICGNGVYIWLLKYGDKKYRFIHVGKSTVMLKRTKEHMENTTKESHSDCIVTDSFEEYPHYGDDFITCELKCVNECPGRQNKTSSCNATNKKLIKKYLNNTHVLYLSPLFSGELDCLINIDDLIHRLEGTMLTAAIDYFKIKNGDRISDGNKYVTNTIGKTFNYHDKKNNCEAKYLQDIRNTINDCIEIFPD
jgi:hypothetical protein